MAFLAVLQQETWLSPLVRSLEGLVQWMFRLRDPKSDTLDNSVVSLFPSADEVSKNFICMVELIRACSRLISVNINFTSQNELAMVSSALHASRPTLEMVHVEAGVGNFSIGVRSNINDKLVHEALLLPVFDQIEKLVLSGISLDVSPPLGVTLPLKSLQIQQQYSHLSAILQFLPSQSSRLVTFDIRFSRADAVSLTTLLDAMPSTLESLSLQCGPSHDLLVFRPSRTEYSRNQSLPPIPLENLSRLTHLRTLKLTGFQGPSLTLLSNLSNSSPHLVHLDFSQSFWIAHNGLDTTSSRTILHSIFPQEEILQALTSFKFLQYPHLGYLPTRTRQRLHPLQTWMTALGVDMQWVECRPHHAD